MFDIRFDSNDRIHLSGRFDGAQAEKAKSVLESVTKSCVIDMKELEYISSAGLGVLFALQKRLLENGQKLTLTNLNQHIRDVFQIARFNLIFDIK